MDFGWHSGLKACSGAEVNILPDGSFAIRMVQISVYKKLVQIGSKKEYSASPDQLKATDLQGPVAVVFTGKGVLIKKTARLETVTEQIVRYLFPGFKQDEFYLQHFQSADHSFIAFVRKEIVDSVLSVFRKQGTEILILSLGPFVIDHVIPQLNQYGSDLNFNGHQVILNEEREWLDYRYEAGIIAEFELKIDIEPIAEHFLLAYAAAFQLLLNDRLEIIAVESEEIRLNLLESVARSKFNKRGMLILITFFVLLLLNFLLFSYINNVNQELAGKAGQRSDFYTDRQKLEAEVKEKETQVKMIGWNRGLPYAYLCDRIGQTIPTAVTLSELSIGTIREPQSTAKQKTELGKVKVTGQSANVYVIHDWIYALRQQPWVKAVQLEKYATDDQKGTQVFTLIINY